MNGAESLVKTLLASGVDTCFANPGTSEMHFVAALDRIPGMRCVLGLFEGVVTGAADGYARMAGQAWRRRCCIADQAWRTAWPTSTMPDGRGPRADGQHRRRPGDLSTGRWTRRLTADTEGWARPVSGWTRTASHAATGVGADAAAGRAGGHDAAPGQIATLILPSDTSWDEGGVVAAAKLPPPPAAHPGRCRHDRGKSARILRSGQPAMVLLMSGRALRAGLAGPCRRHRGAELGCTDAGPTPPTRAWSGAAGRIPIERVPYPSGPCDQGRVRRVEAHLAGGGGGCRLGSSPIPASPAECIPEDCTVHVPGAAGPGRPGCA